MERFIVAWQVDDDGDWIAALDCLHSRHVRHRPPFRDAPWVLDERGRAAHVGAALDCARCDQAELPERLRHVRTTPAWTEAEIPQALLADHRIASGRWGIVEVESGSVRFVAETDPPIDRLLGPGDRQPIPPDVPHRLAVVGPVRVAVSFHRR